MNSSSSMNSSDTSTVEPSESDDDLDPMDLAVRENARLADETEMKLAGVALRHLKTDHVHSAMSDYAAHVRAMPDADRAALNDDDAMTAHADNFFRAHATTHPAQAREVPTMTSRALQKKHGVKW